MPKLEVEIRPLDAPYTAGLYRECRVIWGYLREWKRNWKPRFRIEIKQAIIVVGNSLRTTRRARPFISTCHLDKEQYSIAN